MFARRNFAPDTPPKPSRSSRVENRIDRLAHTRTNNHPSNRVDHSTDHRYVEKYSQVKDRTNQVVSFPQTATKSTNRKNAKLFRSRGVEAIFVVGVNLFLSVTALTALTKLLPYQNAERERLEEINTEVQLVEQRVNVLRARLPQIFGSGNSQKALLRREGLIGSDEKAIKLIPPSQPVLPSSSTASSDPQTLP